MKNQIPKTVLAERLDKILNAETGLDGLNTLLYGWTRKDLALWEAIRHRNWLYDYEVQAFSQYVGYDLLNVE
ncbi:MAG: hypothetical protein J6M55_05700 [Paludibacteraceae bacterium]|jgi:hypothetical protein|nr:hypothetical protein [Paludibacteraceae bacterium]